MDTFYPVLPAPSQARQEPAPAGKLHTPLIAVVEDDRDTLEMFRTMLAMAGYHPMLLGRSRDAHLTLRLAQPDVVLLDLWLEKRDSGELLLDLLQGDPRTQHIPFIVCSAHLDGLRGSRPLLARQAAAIIQKPFAMDSLLSAITKALAERQLR